MVSVLTISGLSCSHPSPPTSLARLFLSAFPAASLFPFYPLALPLSPSPVFQPSSPPLLRSARGIRAAQIQVFLKRVCRSDQIRLDQITSV